MHFQPIEHTEGELGSEGHIGAATMLSNDTTASPVEDPLDDVFGADSPEHVHHGEPRAAHPSDMRRLENDHTTAGYREGLTVAKATSVQDGFDEGFSLGAAVGQEVGLILGVLQGLAEACRSASHPEAAAVERLLGEAHEELAMGAVYSSEYWGGDGNWKFEVEANAKAGEVLFEDVAKQHPVIRKWLKTLKDTQAKWGINMGVLEDEGGEREDAGAEDPKTKLAADTANRVTPKQALDW